MLPSALHWMPRPSVALFLSTLALAGGTVACSHTPEAGKQGGEGGEGGEG